MIFPADYVGDFHFQIIHHIDKMKNIRTIRTSYYHIWRIGLIRIIDGDISTHQIVHCHWTTLKTKAPRTITFIDTTRI